MTTGNQGLGTMFLFWGRRGVIGNLAASVQAEAMNMPDVRAYVSVSRHNENYPSFEVFGDRVCAVDTFGSNIGALTCAWRLFGIRRQLTQFILENQIGRVVALMPHVWSPFVIGSIKDAGAEYVSVIHDAAAHPGDHTAYLNRLIMQDTLQADIVVTLSRHVNDQMAQDHPKLSGRLRTLFLPDITYDEYSSNRQLDQTRPFKVLFLGRIMEYKGLGILIDAVERLKNSQREIHLGVYGEGDLSQYRNRLEALNADVANSWLTDEEVSTALATYDAVVLPYTEASQSGVASAALGARLPVIVAPTAGLKEQVVPGKTGLVTRGLSGADFAETILSLATNDTLYSQISEAQRATASDRSVKRFTQSLCELS